MGFGQRKEEAKGGRPKKEKKVVHVTRCDTVISILGAFIEKIDVEINAAR